MKKTEEKRKSQVKKKAEVAAKPTTKAEEGVLEFQRLAQLRASKFVPSLYDHPPSSHPNLHP